MPNKAPAIVAWEQIRQGNLQGTAQNAALQGIRIILKNVKQPKKLHSDTWQIFCDFITNVSDERLLDLICSFEWSTKAPEAKSLSPSLQKFLIDRKHARDNIEAQEQYRRLFLYVFKRLCEREKKQLTVKELSSQLSLPTLSETDHQLLNNLLVWFHALEVRVQEHEVRLGVLEQHLDREQAEAYIGQEVADCVDNLLRDYTKLFVGRETTLKQLDEFLTEKRTNLLRLIAPAGFGKTALLANWVASRKDDGCFILYHFFSQRYDVTRSFSAAYRNLLRQLYDYYEPSDRQIPNNEDELRDKLYCLIKEYSERDGRPLVIVLDALDEAEPPFRQFLPLLPENVFLIASARAEEGQEPEYLRGWTDNALPIRLDRLDSSAIAQWLREAGELAAFAEDDHFIAQLEEITQGFPLYLHFLTDELIKAQPGDVQAVLTLSPKGFGAYVREQFKLLAKVKELRQRKVQLLFALLSVALGALSEDDIREITKLNEWDLAALPWQVTRWFSIQTGFYSFAHPLLAKEFQGVLPGQSSSVKERLIKCCSRWQKHQSHYALRHYAEHLHEVKRWEELYAIALDEDFASAQQEHLPDEPDLPLKTVQIALLGATEIDNAGAMAEFLLVHAKHCAEKMAQQSPLDALHNGNLKRALALADLLDVEICVLWYLLLAWVLKDQTRWQEAQETLDQLQHKKLPRLSNWQGDYAAYLLTYAFEVSEKAFLALYKQILDYRSHLALCKNLIERGYFTVALSAALSIDIEWARIQALGEVTVALARAGDFTRALNTIDQLKEQKQRWLGKIAVTIAVAGDFDTSLSTVQQVHDKVEQAKALAEIAKSIAIVAKLHSDILFACFRAGEAGLLILLIATWYREVAQFIFNTAFKTALSINDKRQQVRILWEIAKSIAIAGNTKAARSTLDTALEITQLIEYHQQHEREYELGEIAAVIAIAGDYPTALKMAEQINDERLNSLALVNIVKALARAGNFPLALNIAKQIRDGVEQARALGKVVKAMARAGDFATALKRLQQIDSEAEYTWTLVEIVLSMAELEDFTTALKTTKRIYPNGHARAWALGKIAMTMVAAGNKDAALSTFKIALETERSIRNQQQQQDIVQRVQTITRNGSILGVELFAKVKIKLKTRLIVTEEDFTPALENAYQCWDERHKAWALGEIAEIMALVGLSEQAVKTAMSILVNRHWLLPRVASIFAKTGDKQNFKHLLVPCAYYLYAADQMCEFLMLLYPEQAMDVEKVVSQFR
jgi:hypothetical protein